eukprot:TRINITY_DN38040_c0_g3_i2.p1 TRINITY_DN38040_c0_g3~~TRINITY_DN38040_c0_g3_i2.p1  ORF type:complete len:329 (-),score=24.17 TRINITY_DN38040_c0_g3_i2:97-1083(-)
MQSTGAGILPRSYFKQQQSLYLICKCQKRIRFERNYHLSQTIAKMSETQAGAQVLVYNDEGAGIRSVKSAITSLQKELSSQIKVVECSAEDIIEYNILNNNTKMLVMPGGADLPYCAKLNGVGNSKIKEYVLKGGSYLGLCAGAYYACDRIEFEMGTPQQVKGERELKFFDGVARGSVVPGFHYANEKGSAACTIKFKTANQGNEVCLDYVNGGPGFYPLSDSEKFQPIAYYMDIEGTPLNALRCTVGGGVAVLCGSHPELDVNLLNNYSETLNKQSEEYIKVMNLCNDLTRNTRQRQEFWKTLLINANMESSLKDVSSQLKCFVEIC